MINEGVGHAVDVPQRGDIIVFYDLYYGNGDGHLAIYIDQNTMYDHNNGYHDNCCAGYCNLNYTGNDFKWGYVYIRTIPQPGPIPDSEPVPQSQLEPALQNIRLYGYMMCLSNGQAACSGQNECGFIFPSKLGGLEYEIRAGA